MPASAPLFGFAPLVFTSRLRTFSLRYPRTFSRIVS